MRKGMILKSAAIGFVAMLIVLFMFWASFQFIERQNAMRGELRQLGSQAFWDANGFDIIFSAIFSTLFVMFASGMTATIVSYSGKIEGHGWIFPSIISASFTVFIILLYLFLFIQSTVINSSLPSGNELIVFGIIVVLIVAALYFLLSAFGGYIAQSKMDYIPYMEKK